jgi:hypothetical protein
MSYSLKLTPMSYQWTMSRRPDPRTPAPGGSWLPADPGSPRLLAPTESGTPGRPGHPRGIRHPRQTRAPPRNPAPPADPGTPAKPGIPVRPGTTGIRHPPRNPAPRGTRHPAEPGDPLVLAGSVGPSHLPGPLGRVNSGRRAAVPVRRRRQLADGAVPTLAALTMPTPAPRRLIPGAHSCPRAHSCPH